MYSDITLFMKRITVKPEDGFRLVISNGVHKIISDQPEGAGTDRGMQPVELFVASLAACVAVYAIPFLKRRNMDEKNLTVEAEYVYTNDPKRIGKINIKVKIAHPLSEKELKALHKIISSCTVHNSITHTPDISFNISGK